MHLRHTSLHSWLSLRVRAVCVAVFVTSLFLPPYVPQSASAIPDVDVSEQAQSYLLAEDGFLMKTSSLTQEGSRGNVAQGIVHTVEQNESINGIAKMSDLSPDTIRWANGLKPGEAIRPGQKLLILPVDGVVHTVRRGQNLTSIAELYNIDKERIVEQNRLEGGYLLAGQELIIPGGKPITPVSSKVLAREDALSFHPSLPIEPLTLPGGRTGEELKPQETFGIMQRPCNCFITQYFTSYHYGLDMQERGGGPVFAAEDGTVIRADYGWNGGYGNVVEIDHGNGVVTLYAHNKELKIQAGQKVQRGQLISLMGNTGLVHGPTGIHVHFEVHVNGVKKNPLLYLQE